MKQKQLNYVANLIVEAFQASGLDAVYIDEKKQMFLRHDSKEQTLAWACNYLDDKNTEFFCQKLGITTAMLRVTAHVLSKI